MEDVIFAGSAARPGLGLAEVSISFDNSNGSVPLDYEEIVVSRRLYRTGESEYFLNKTPTRLIDIQELLSDFGVGRELTAVIGQNRLERVLSSRPEERRAFVEETAGLLKHRRRKEKALRKLEGTEQNLIRIGDIISEVRRQLKPLERQAEMAREYQALERELKGLQIKLVVSELRELHRQWEGRVEEEERMRAEFEERQRFLREGRQRLQQMERKIDHLRDFHKERRENLYALSSYVERLRNRVRLTEERLKFLSREGEPSFSASELLRRREGRELRFKELVEMLEESQREELDLEKKIEERESIRWELASTYSQLGKKKSQLAEDVRHCRQQCKYTGAKIEELRKEKARLEERRAKLSEQYAAAEKEVEEASRQVRRFEELMEKERRALAEREGRRESLLLDVENLRQRLEEVGRLLGVSERDEALVVARLQALQELFARRIDYAQAAGRVLQESGGIPGIRGMILHLVKIDPDWERAIESFLGPWLFALVVDRTDSALKAIRLLKEEDAGFALFLCLDEFKRYEKERARGKTSLQKETMALDVVDAEDYLQPVLEHLLGDVVLCRTLEEAVERAEIYPRLTFITVEGEIISPGRIIKGGGKSRSPFHLLAKRREIEQLQEMLEVYDEEGLRLKIERKSMLAAVQGVESELEGLEREAQSLRDSLRRRELEQREALLREQQKRDQVIHLLAMMKENEEKRGSIEEQLGKLEAEMARLEDELEGWAPVLSRLERETAEAKTRLEEEETALKELHYQRASLKERVSHLKERVEEASAALEELDRLPAGGRGEASPNRERVEELISVIQELLEHAEAVRGRQQLALEQVEKKIAELDEAIHQLRAELERCEERVEELRELVHNRDIVVVQLKARVDLLAQKLLDEYQVSLESALQDYLTDEPVEGMRVKVEELLRRKQAMGQINPCAVEEYQALKDRHDFLLEQVEDLKESKAALNKVIRAIDKEIIRIFKETFDQTNLHFQELFTRLFPNGKAELVLTEPDDLLNTGVDIEAQPSGKRLKKLSLLSGGETALISLAFLFALFKTRPSPFYFLDEVEAALDDVNLHRFLRMVQEFKQDSQLIIITHQKRTMEIADILYGVSMQADGISQVVSQRFEEAKDPAHSGAA
jgi:chromosome segregation protein